MARNENLTTGSEDNRLAEEHSRNAAENADALAASARRNEARVGTTGPVQGLQGSASESTAEAEANQRRIKEDHDAMQADARRVEASAPPEVRGDRPRNA